ncbi:Heterokaryon incompatibility protein [Paramyrothecium foliicola]|nr:Heterokaryon incompatibility protein [Paramyrothecium foliicola]
MSKSILQPAIPQSTTSEECDDNFTCSALESATTIRIVSIARLDWENDNVPELLMRHVDLASEPIYDTLSYTWGTPVTVYGSAEERDKSWDDDKKGVLCNGKNVLVTSNLWCFLKTWRTWLRKGASTTTTKAPLNNMWIDAICIDQANVEEKSAQISLMGRIYSQCRRVNIWLGPQDKFTRPAIKLLTQIADIQLDRMESAEGSDYDICEKLGLPPPHSNRWCSIYTLLLRSWFSRTWVVQEFALAPSAQMLCGNIAFDWILLGYAMVKLESVGIAKEIMDATFHKIQPNVDTSSHLCRTGHSIAFTTMKRVDKSPHHSVLQLVQFAGIGSSNIPHQCSGSCKKNGKAHLPSLLQVVQSIRHLDVTDPRDKIWGILGLYEKKLRLGKPPPEFPIVVDHRDTVAQVYLDFAWHALLESRNLDLLSLVTPQRHVEGMPTWTPDWSVSTRSSSTAWGATGPGAHKQWVWHPPCREKMFGAILPVSGIPIDSITEGGTANASLITTLPEVARIVCKLAPQYPWSKNPQSLFEVLWRSLIFDSIEGHSPAPQSYGMHFKDSWIWTIKQGWWSWHSYKSAVINPEWEATWEAYVNVHFTIFPDDEATGDNKDVLSLKDRAAGVRAKPELPSGAKFGDTSVGGARYQRPGVDEIADRKKRLKDIVDASPDYPPNSDGEVEKLVDHLAVARGMAPFRTERGYFGLGAPSLAAKDQVWLLRGSKALAILRPSGNQQFNFVGLAYLHGDLSPENGKWENARPVSIELT